MLENPAERSEAIGASVPKNQPKPKCCISRAGKWFRTH